VKSRLEIVSLEEGRRVLDAARNPVILCGAGVSMIPPTSLPSGNALRDICVRKLLSDPASADIISRLSASPAYQALLPEVVLQLMGSTVGVGVDRFIANLVKNAEANGVHRYIAEHFSPVFTTNFDLCFERAGARQTLHLHGSAADPESMQNRIFRLGKTSLRENSAFKRLAHRRVLMIIGYSLRDEDVIRSLTSFPPELIIYLSRSGSPPEAYRRLRSPLQIAKGSAEEFFGVPSLASAATPRRTIRPSPHKLPPLGKRANALLRVCSRAAQYDLGQTLIQSYRPRLSGRPKLLAMCEVADNLRILGRFEEAVELCQEVLSDVSARRPYNADIVSTVHVEMGLCDLDRGSREFEAIEKHFMAALEVFNPVVERECGGRFAVESEIWRARIFNNLGLLYAAKGDHKKSIVYLNKSLKIKQRHHELYGRAQTLSNMAKVQISAGLLTQAAQALSQVVDIMRETPDKYICQDAIIEILAILSETRHIKIQRGSVRDAVVRSDAWWRSARRRARMSGAPLVSIINYLIQLRTAWQKVA
jgi:tetratricopeptide (TPR) repeat protein